MFSSIDNGSYRANITLTSLISLTDLCLGQRSRESHDTTDFNEINLFWNSRQTYNSFHNMQFYLQSIWETAEDQGASNRQKQEEAFQFSI